jgi:hypothetical protein
MKVELTPEELGLLREALDSHDYWQLAEPHYRRDGGVDEPGSDDPSVVEEREAVKQLEKKLAAAVASS